MEVVVLTTLAAFLRGGMLLSTIDVPGDGTMKAWMAYYWAHAPYLVLHGIWPPGLVYLTGPLTYFLPIWIALRLFNAIVGTATVPVLFTAVKRVFGPSTGLIAAGFIAVFPLHVELSATSLTEASAILEILLGLIFLTMAAQPGAHYRAVLNGLAISCFLLASMTRYELWFLLPLFPSYYWLRTRDWVMASVMAALLVAFPTVWTIGNHIYEGNALLGIGAAMHDRGFGDTHVAVPLTAAMKILVMRFGTSLGWVPMVLLVLGMVMECRCLRAGRLSPERILYFAIVLVLLLGTGAFTGRTRRDPSHPEFAVRPGIFHADGHYSNRRSSAAYKEERVVGRDRLGTHIHARIIIRDGTFRDSVAYEGEAAGHYPLRGMVNQKPVARSAADFYVHGLATDISAVLLSDGCFANDHNIGMDGRWWSTYLDTLGAARFAHHPAWRRGLRAAFCQSDRHRG
jgi:hypothetical protein